MASPINSTYVRKTNRQRVLQQIRNSEGISRQDLAERIGLTPPAITGIVRDWLQKKVVKEEGRGASGGGRRPVRLVLNRKAALAIGAEFSRQQVRISVTDLLGKVVEQQEWNLDMSDPKAGVLQFAKELKSFLDTPKYKKQKMLGIGIATSGLYNYQSHKIQRSVNLGKAWDNFNIEEALGKEISLPIRVENNSNACALAEYWLIQEEKIEDLVWVHIGEGISAGLIQKGQWVRGRSNYSGEIGHISLHPGGELCNCGNHGCLEAYWGWQGIKNRLTKDRFFTKKKIAAEDFRMKHWIQLVQEKDPEGLALAEEMGKDIGKIVSQVINLLNPAQIFLGGPLAQTLSDSFPSLLQTVKEQSFPEVAREARISFSQMAGFGGSLGGCALILQETFQKPNSEIFEMLEGE